MMFDSQNSDLAFPMSLLMYAITEDDALVFEYNPAHSVESEFKNGHVGLLIHSQ